MQESLARILEEKSRLEKEKEALEAAEDAAAFLSVTAVVEETHLSFYLCSVGDGEWMGMDGNGMIVHRC